MSRISFFNDILSSVLDRRAVSTAAANDDRSLDELSRALLSARGEVSGNQLSRSILDGFAAADEADQMAFFCWMLNELDIDSEAASTAIKDYHAAPSAENWERFNTAAEPSRLELLRRINRIPEATERLVRMREALYAFLPGNEQLQRLDSDFERLFKLWFNRGFLVLHEIDWSTPANILEKIIRYEAVHEINDWKDLRSRLLPSDRKCFAFFHPAMQDEPLIFVEVALTQDIPDSIQSVLTTERETIEPHEATEAVFYSISNCQPGLRGVSFGNFLIKHVATELASNYPNIKKFRTLSPVPTLMSWLQKEASPEHQATYEHALTLQAQLQPDSLSELTGEDVSFDPEEPIPAMQDVVELASPSIINESDTDEPVTNESDTDLSQKRLKKRSQKRSQNPTLNDSAAADEDFDQADIAEVAEEVVDETPDTEVIARELCRVAAHYLVEVKRGDSQPRDPVARFHLGNGAALDAVLPLADCTVKGFRQSAGVMVSYLYDLDKVISQHEDYAGHRIVTHSKSVAQLIASDGTGEKSRFRIPGMRRTA